MKSSATTRGDSSSSSAPRMGRLRFRRKKKRKREEEEDSEEEDETTSKNNDEKLEALLENAYRHDRAIKRLNKETEQELRSTIVAFPEDDLTTFAKKYAGKTEDIRQRHSKGVGALRKRLEAKSELSRATATKGCVDEHDVDNRARKKARFDESDDDRNTAKETSDENGSFALTPIPRVPGATR